MPFHCMRLHHLIVNWIEFSMIVCFYIKKAFDGIFPSQFLHPYIQKTILTKLKKSDNYPPTNVITSKQIELISQD